MHYGPIRTRPYFAKLIDRYVNHKLSCVRTNDTSGTNFRPGQTNIKGDDGLPLRRAVLGQLWPSVDWFHVRTCLRARAHACASVVIVLVELVFYPRNLLEFLWLQKVSPKPRQTVC